MDKSTTEITIFTGFWVQFVDSKFLTQIDAFTTMVLQVTESGPL